MVKVNYEKSYENNFKTNVNEAVKFYLADYKVNSGEGFILYPQALNPFLKIMETMNECKNIIILPAFNSEDYNKVNQPAYLFLKINGESYDYVKAILTNCDNSFTTNIDNLNTSMPC
jgi:hypothetical protein